jgi:tetratricopeptide (TPR) repeat protein
VLEGSVRKSGARVRITAQLIDASNSAHVWSETYDRDIHDIFGVQREIAAAVADALRVKLSHAGPRRAETTSTEAYEHYLQGRHQFNRRSAGDLVQAKAHFEAAVRIDPDYARAWSGLAGVYFVSQYEDVHFPDALKNWGDAAQRAVALAPDLAEAHARAAQYYMTIHEQATANAHAERAAALDPADPMVLAMSMSEALVAGRLSEAIDIQRRMVATDPLSASQRGNLGTFLIMVDRLPEAQAELERSLELSPASPASLTSISDALFLQGRTDEALEVIARMPDGYLKDERRAVIAFARGDAEEGNEILEHMVALTKQPDFDPGAAVAIAEVFGYRRDTQRAFEWLERALPRTERQLALKPRWLLIEDLQVTPYLKSLHADPRWRALLAKIEPQFN